MVLRSTPVTTQDLRAIRDTSHSLFENASMGILAVNNEGRIVDANALLLKLFGYEYAELSVPPWIRFCPTLSVARTCGTEPIMLLIPAFGIWA